MREDFIHFLWQTKRFDLKALQTTKGEPIRIIHPGIHNLNSGPDFCGARIQIGTTEWAGNVEMHVRSSDWYKHGHQTNRAYNNVVLHVVYEEDRIINRDTGEPLACLELKGRIPHHLFARFLKLYAEKSWIPCISFLPGIQETHINLWLNRCLVERMEQKVGKINDWLSLMKNDWEVVFYILLARSFGQSINGLPFEQLALNTPLKLISKYRNSLFQLEALLFGQAGFLEGKLEDNYPVKLQEEYHFLKSKYGLQPLQKEVWKFSKLRPANFPTIRLAQFAYLLYATDHLLGKVLAANSILEIENMFNVKLSNYWIDHYVWDRPSAKVKKTLGQGAVHSIIINTILPFIFAYGAIHGNKNYMENALQLMETLPAEKIRLIEKFGQLGVKVHSASISQALIHLKNNYCDSKKCMKCGIGNYILKGSEGS